MIKEVFVVKKGTALYYAYVDWRPKFSANLEDAKQYDTYEDAKKFIETGGTSDEGYGNWLRDGFYQIEKVFVVTDDE